jgi:lysophospholipase L1-like esterase
MAANRGEIMLLGSSFVKRLQQFRREMVVDGKRVELRGYPGATVAKLDGVVRSLEDQKYKTVILQIGSNDLTHQRCTPDAFIDSLSHLVNFLVEQRGVQKVVVMEILFRQHANRFRMRMTIQDYNNSVRRANQLLAARCSVSSRMLFWQHGRYLHGRQVICNDGVHLNDAGLRRYWRSVRGAVLKSIW